MMCDKRAVLLKKRELYGYIFKSRNAAFSEAVHSQIYVDKTELISYTNNVLATNQKKYLRQPPKEIWKIHYSQYAGCLL